MEVNKHKADLDAQQNPRKRQRVHKRIGISIWQRIGIEELPDDVLIAILSCMSIKNAVRTSVLSSRWKCLWMFTSGTLEFHDSDFATTEEFIALVNRFLESLNPVDGLAIHFSNARRKTDQSTVVDKWIYSAMLKQVKGFELDLSAGSGFHDCSPYEFPSFAKLAAQFRHEKWDPLGDCFVSLRSLRLISVNIKDEMVLYFLESCPFLEQLCIRDSNATENLEIADPLPNLKELEISDCSNIWSLVISAAKLATCTYQGQQINFLPFEKIRNLTLGGVFCKSFIYEPNKHASYTNQLEKLVLNLNCESVQTPSLGRKIAPPSYYQFRCLKRLELNIVSQVGRSLLFFISFITASAYLREFKLKIDYLVARPWYDNSWIGRELMPFPEVTSVDDSGRVNYHLNVVKMDGYCGCRSEEDFLEELFDFAPCIRTVFINTDCDYYCDHHEENVLIYRLREDGKNLMTKEMREAEIMKNQRLGPFEMTPFEAKKHAEKVRHKLARILDHKKFVVI